MTAPSLAERYVAEGYDLERLPLPAPFDFLATGKDRVAAFASAGRVSASTLVDVRLMARELGARAVFVAASFSDEARRIAERFGIELVDTPPRESEAYAPVPAPPQPEEAVPVHAAPPVGVTVHDFDEFPTPDELRQELAEVNSVLVEARPALTPEQTVEVALAEAATPDEVLALHPPEIAFLPREVDTHHASDLVAATEAAISHHPAEEVQEDLAAWYEALCALEAEDRLREAVLAVEPSVGDDLADWYDALLELEADTLAAEAAEERAFADLAPLALHGMALAPALDFTPPAAAAEVFREVEAAVPGVADVPVAADVPAPFPELAWPEVEELAPLARHARVLAAEPHFGAPDRGAVAFRTVEDAAPDLPSFAFAVPTPDPVPAEAPAEAVAGPTADEGPETFTQVESPFLNPASVLPWTPNAPMPVAGFVPATPVLGAPPPPPAEVVDAETGAIAAVDTPTPAPRAMLPWTPSVRTPTSGADPALFADAFAKAQAWNTVQRIEGIRQEARDAVHAATDVPKPKAVTQVAPDTDFELL